MRCIAPTPKTLALVAKSRGARLPVRGSFETRLPNTGALRELERLLINAMELVFAGKATEVEQRARRELRAQLAAPVAVGADPRIAAFLNGRVADVFESVESATQIYQPDPFDVEAIHMEARDDFATMVTRATAPEHVRCGRGQTLLLLGESGCGKTHLLRALRHQTHRARLGYAAYMQLGAEMTDTTRSVLCAFVDALEQPYAAPLHMESGLAYLSQSLAYGRAALDRAQLDRLMNEELDAQALVGVAGALTDAVLRTEGLGEIEPDLITALLLLQRRDPALRRRVIKYLRCEALSSYEQQLLGGLTPRTQPEDALRMFKQLARLVFEMQMAACVLLVDQLEDAMPNAQEVTRIQMALDVLRSVADSVPNVVVVIACLEDVYTALRGRLSRSLIDRLETDPSPLRLTTQRQRHEIEQLLALRLAQLYSAQNVDWREEDPLFPYTSGQVEKTVHLRARDCLRSFAAFRKHCIAVGRLVDATTVSATVPVLTPPTSKPDAEAERLRAAREEFHRNWAVESRTVQVPDHDNDVLAVMRALLLGRAAESNQKLEVAIETVDGVQQLRVRGGVKEAILRMCDRAAQRGALGGQIEALTRVASAKVKPIALRRGDFEFGAKSRVTAQLGRLIEAGGAKCTLQEHELRRAAALVSLARAHGEHIWRSYQPAQQLAVIESLWSMLDIAVVNPSPTLAPSDAPPTSAASAPHPAPTRAGATGTLPPPVVEPRISQPLDRALPAKSLLLGQITAARATDVVVSFEQIKTHAAVLGTTGSGKTTAVLNMLEQLLAGGIPTVMVDRKGDLSSYADEAWWQETPERQALRSKIELRLYTPGVSGGRPLRLPLAPHLKDAPPDDIAAMANVAARGLAQMMGYGSGPSGQMRESILNRAISILATEDEVTLDALCACINRPDPELVAGVGPLHRHFRPLAENLESLKIMRGPLLAAAGETLEVKSLLQPTAAGKPPLTIISLGGLNDVPAMQFWVSRLLVDLVRFTRANPAPELQAVVFFDEADLYLPATEKPPSKEPMLDLLKRARSGGVGIVLASQNPADFDYKARDNIGMWLIGKIAQDRAIGKMRNLLEGFPDAARRISSQHMGQFVVLGSGAAKEMKGRASMMKTVQRNESEIEALARAQRDEGR